jgi:hypothetical protein
MQIGKAPFFSRVEQWSCSRALLNTTLYVMDGVIMINKSTKRVHWATGPVLACDHHTAYLKQIGGALGMHVHIEDYEGDEPCINCVNYEKKFGKKEEVEGDGEAR